MPADQTHRAPRPGPKRSEGQWALGDRAPLNSTEQFKLDDDGLNVRQRILDVYSVKGFTSIPPDDLRGRFRWQGLYTQRRPGIDGGRTGSLEPEELEDEYFMLRVRIAGGQLDTTQLRVIGELSRRYARDTADVTNRQDIQLHWIRVEDVPAIWTALEAVGLSTTEACGDTPRNMLGCPLAGVAEDEIIDGSAEIAALGKFVGDPTYSNLPRKYKTALSGCAQHCTVQEINDVAFVGVIGPDGTAGYDLWVGGGLSTNPIYGQRLGVFVPPADVSRVWEGVTGIFRDHGYRRIRGRARLKFLVADWGPLRFREVLENDYLGGALQDGPPPAAPTDPRRDHVGVHRQKDGRFYLGVAPRVGRVSGSKLVALANLAEQHGSQRVRTTIEQKLIVLDVPADRVDSLSAELEKNDLLVRPSAFRRQTMACTGIEFCKLAIVNTKDRAQQVIAELEQRMPDFASPLTININGCPNSCVRMQTADIGLKGQIVTTADGNQVGGFQVQLGGGMSEEVGFGRKVRGLKVTEDEVAEYIERVLRRFEATHTPDQDFSTWVVAASDEQLS